MGRLAPGGSILALRGVLGAGKTTLAKGIARGLGIDEEVTSPTYTIVSEYEGRLHLHHVDAYRLAGEADFIEVGGEDLLADRDGLCLVEWSERIPAALPPEAATAERFVAEDGSRLLKLDWPELEDRLA